MLTQIINHMNPFERVRLALLFAVLVFSAERFLP